jgi:translation initiation factor 2D
MVTFVRASGTKSNPPNLVFSENDSDDESKEESQDPSSTGVTTNESKDTIPESKQEIEEKEPEPEIDHDSLVNYIFMAALKTKIKDKELPILFSNIWSNYMLPCRPNDVQVDIKKSKYKKVTKRILWDFNKIVVGFNERNGGERNYQN